MTTVTRRTGNILAAVFALLLTAGLIVRTSSAAFTATTDNTGNSVAAGTMTLDDDNAGGTALLELTNMAPGQSQSNCIEVIYAGTLTPQELTIWAPATAVSAPAGFDSEVTITIEEGTGTTVAFDNCGDFTPVAGAPIVNAVDFAVFDNSTNFSNGVASGWTPAGQAAPATSSKFYRVTLGIKSTTNDAFQGASLSNIAIAWGTESA